MEDRETPRMRKYGESKTTRIMMATVPHVTSGSGLRKFQADGFLFDRLFTPDCTLTTSTGDCICSHKYTPLAQDITWNRFYCITKQRSNNTYNIL